LKLFMYDSVTNTDYYYSQKGMWDYAASRIFRWALASYGPEAKATRELMRQGVAQSLTAIWPEDGTDVPKLEMPGTEPPIAKVEAQLRMLSPQNDSQRSLIPRVASHRRPAADAVGSRWPRRVIRCQLPSVIVVLWLRLFSPARPVAPRMPPLGGAGICAAAAWTHFLILKWTVLSGC
jgi:hypothetical protein